MPKHHADAVADVLEHVYAAALDSSGWQPALEKLAELFGARAAMLFIADWSSGDYDTNILFRHRVDPDVIDQWQAHYLPHDLWSYRMRDLPAGFVTTGAAVVAPRDLQRSPFYNDLLAKIGWQDALSASLARSATAEVPISFYGCGELFQQSHIRLLERLAPHLRRAVHLQLQLGAARQRVGALEDVVNRVAVGVLTLAADGTVVWASRHAESMLSAGDGLTLRDGRLTCARRTESAALTAAIGSAGGLGGQSPTGHVVSVSRPSGRRSYALLVAPLQAHTADASPFAATAGRRATVLVTVSDPERRPEVLPDRLARLFGLTPAEARLAAALAADCALDQYADGAGITMNTARWTLKQVLAKTGCRRQSELVRLVLTIAAGVSG